MTKTFAATVFLLFLINNLYPQDLIFSKSAGSDSGSSDLDHGNDIVTDDLGNVYVTGTMSKGTTGSVFGQGEVNQTTLNVNGAFIAKYDSNGLLLWAKQLETNNNQIESNAITLDDDNNIYITGYFFVEVTFGIGTTTATKLYSNSRSRDVFFAKYSQNGDFLWAKSFGGARDDAPGGRSIKVDSSHNIYISGSINDVVVFGKGEPNETTVIANYDMFISKYTENGDLIWVRNAGGNRHASAKNMDLDSKNNIYITGNFFYEVTFAESEPNEIELKRHNEQAYIAKYDTNGQFIWAKSPYFYSDDTSNISGDIKVIDDDHIVYTGAYGTYGNTYLTNCIKLEGEDQYDGIVIQFDSNGNYIWNATINTIEGDRGLALDVDQAGNIFVTGYFGGDTTLNKELCNEKQISNNGSSDIFINSYDINGQLLSNKIVGGIGWEQASAIDVDNLGNISITGYYSDDILFGETQTNKTTLVKNGVHEIYVAKYHLDLTNIPKKPYAGENNCLDVCKNSSPIDLFNQLLNNPDSGGIWSPSLASGSGIFDPLVDTAGIYRYNVMESNCISDYAEITIDFTSGMINAGEDTAINICSQETPFSLIDRIEGNPDIGGMWSPSLSGGTDMFDPSIDAAGIYTYTITDGVCSSDSSEVSVNINVPPNAGENGNLELCMNSSAVDLFDSLTGTPDIGGIWTPGLSSGRGIFDPSMDTAGVYIYTVTNGVCSSDTSEVNVAIDVLPNAGENGNLELCINSSSVDLFDSLTGTPDIGGVWTPNLTSGAGIFDPTMDTAGVYTYTVTNGVCSSDTSDVNVTITNVTPISDYEIKTKEFSNNNTIEIIINSNLEYEFSLDGINYQNNNVFYSLAGGDYTVYVREINGCGILEDPVSILDYPKFFTPNSDGNHDTWSLKGKTNKNYSIYIYDRYGKLLKNLTSPESSWDGTFNGQQVPTNDYWFKIVFMDGIIKSGHFTLKR